MAWNGLSQGVRRNGAAMEQSPTRFLTLDGMRGIAAMLVVFYHLHGNLKSTLAQWLPGIAKTFFEHGYLGVQVFFVLSGCAIASSFNDCSVNGRYVARFALRRSIRLDPPYWLSIALAIGLAALSSMLFSDLEKALPSWQQIVAHVFYLQILLGFGDIVPIYWTLCLEVQFYLVLACLLWWIQHAVGTSQVHPVLANRWVQGILLASGAYSVAAYGHVLPGGLPGLFVPFWFYFLLGCAVFWSTQRWLGAGYFWALIVLVAAIGLPTQTVNVGAGLLTALFLYGVLRARAGSRVLASRGFQFLGSISYSLYLFHPIVGWSTISLGKRLLGPELTLAPALLLFLVGIGVSVMTAWIVCVVVERPVQRFSRRIRLAP
jgi:peptidoglycan/LPS O-acetylase OafA/YrhL